MTATDPFGMLRRRCNEIDAMLDRLEDVQRPRVEHTSMGPAVVLRPGAATYGPTENKLDVALWKAFFTEVFPLLEHRLQKHYLDRVASLKAERHRRDIVNG